MARLPNGLISFGSKANCTLELCPVESSILQYQPSIPQNVAIIVLFLISMLLHIAQGIKWRTWDFMIMMIIGCIDEIIGYGGRLMYHQNPFSFNAFLIQIVCITTAPVFFCSAIYVQLSKTINHLDRSVSRFNPKLLVWTFIPSDLISLVLQALGGALSATQAGSSSGNSGVKISQGGLILQVVTLTLFLLLFLDYVVRYQRKSCRGPIPTRIKVFLAFLCLAIVFIFVRCGYRVKELEDGYSGELIHDEMLFMLLEAGMMVIAVFCLNVAHPGIAFGGKPNRRSTIDARGDDYAAIEPQRRDEVKLALLNEQTTSYPEPTGPMAQHYPQQQHQQHQPHLEPYSQQHDYAHPQQQHPQQYYGQP